MITASCAPPSSGQEPADTLPLRVTFTDFTWKCVRSFQNWQGRWLDIESTGPKYQPVTCTPPPSEEKAIGGFADRYYFYTTWNSQDGQSGTQEFPQEFWQAATQGQNFSCRVSTPMEEFIYGKGLAECAPEAESK